MQEIRFHGRGGQGTVVASVVLAKALFAAGYYVQTFPLFGVERRGAPVEAYLRFAREKITIRSGVYTPDHVVVLDARLLTSVPVTAGLKNGGWVLLNASAAPEPADALAGFRMACVDASRIAVSSELGTRTLPMINTAILGALARIMALPPLDLLQQTIGREIAVKPDANARAAAAAYDAVTVVDRSAGSGPEKAPNIRP